MRRQYVKDSPRHIHLALAGGRLRGSDFTAIDGTPYPDELGEAEHVDLTLEVARALLERINPTEIPERPEQP